MAKSRGEDRYYPNEFQDYLVGSTRNIMVEENESKFSADFSSNLKQAVTKLLRLLDSNASKALSYGDKIYSGTAGIAFLYLLQGRSSGAILAQTAILSQAKNEVLKAADRLSRVNDRVSFLNGDVGVVTLAAIIHSIDGDQSKATICAKKIIPYSKVVLSTDSSVPDELLYGRAGYLYALLLAKKYLPSELLPDSLVRKVVGAIISSGRMLSTPSGRTSSRKVPPLQYEWHNKEYVGAAHGYCGILSTLLLAYKQNLISSADVNTYVKPTIDYILDLQYPSKNIPSSVGSKNYDVLVQWCHGAPGAILMVALAYELFGDEKYLKAAIEFGEVTWNRGLLTKGYSLCHGVAGNGYTFLKLYQITKDPKYLHRTSKFAEWCFSYGIKQQFVPDRPFSLFEGVAGVIYFLMDVLEPNQAKFPGVELV